MKARMGKMVDKCAVVGKEEQPLALGIEPSDRSKQRLAGKFHQRCHRVAGVRVR